jgi:4'-phosphopantetheinyl transferase
MLGFHVVVAQVTVLCRSATPSFAARQLLRAALTPNETRRHEQFVKEADANRFLVGRGTLRIEIGRMLGIAPRDVALESGTHGKPLVAGGSPHVNVSHAGDVVVVALSRDAELGIDVERTADRFVEPSIIDISFSRCEIGELAKLPAELHVSAFFHVWTCREAVIKAVGAGFSLPRESFDVCVDPRQPPAVTVTRAPLPRFCLQPIVVPAGHIAMLAVVDVCSVDVCTTG